MLIDEYKLETIWELGCCAQWQSSVARLSVNIGQALPHIAPMIKDSIYDPDKNILRLFKSNRHIYIYPRRISISYVESKDEACTLAKWTKDILNKVTRLRK